MKNYRRERGKCEIDCENTQWFLSDPIPLQLHWPIFIESEWNRDEIIEEWDDRTPKHPKFPEIREIDWRLLPLSYLVWIHFEYKSVRRSSQLSRIGSSTAVPMIQRFPLSPSPPIPLSHVAPVVSDVFAVTLNPCVSHASVHTEEGARVIHESSVRPGGACRGERREERGREGLTRTTQKQFEIDS